MLNIYVKRNECIICIETRAGVGKSAICARGNVLAIMYFNAKHSVNSLPELFKQFHSMRGSQE